MTDEEKQAIERFKNFINTYQDVIEDEYSDYEEKESAKEYQEVSEKILNLIEKQTKEIEELKEDRRIKDLELKKQDKEIEELKEKNKEHKEKIIYWLDRLDLEEALQDEYDELYGCQAAVKILKQLLKEE